MADSGKASKVVVKKLIEDIKFFSNAVKVEANKMMNLSVACKTHEACSKQLNK